MNSNASAYSSSNDCKHDEHKKPLSIVRRKIFDIPIDSAKNTDEVIASLKTTLDLSGTALVTFVNPSVFATLKRDPSFKDLLVKFDMILPDGIGIVLAASYVYNYTLTRVSFDSTSLALPLLSFVHRTRGTIALIGGSPGVAERAALRIRERHPGLRLVAVLDGYGDWSGKIEHLCTLKPDFVICGMGVPAQEKFLLSLVNAGWRGCGLTCGGYLDQLGAGLVYYPGWVNRSNLRWAYRLVREPRRLWRRYFFDYQEFFRIFAIGVLTRFRSKRKA